jgi:hypothetical protein
LAATAVASLPLHTAAIPARTGQPWLPMLLGTSLRAAFVVRSGVGPRVTSLP